MNYSAAGEFKILYSLGKLERYNRVPVNKRAPVAHPLLEAVKVYHADNYGWALACCAWHRDMAEDVLQESYLRVLDGRAKFLGKSSDKTWFFFCDQTRLRGFATYPEETFATQYAHGGK